MRLQTILITILAILTFSCSNITNTDNVRTTAAKFDKITVDKSLKEQMIFYIMENQEEISTPLDKVNEKIKMSSSVALIKLDDSQDRIYNPRNLRCKAKQTGDTLKIDIGEVTGFSGLGISIIVADGLFTTIPYSYSDLVIDGHIDTPQYTIEKQVLTLTQPQFNVGDSLYGHLYSRITDQNKVKYYATGFFRAKL